MDQKTPEMNELGSWLFNAGPNFRIDSVLTKLQLVKVRNKMEKIRRFHAPNPMELQYLCENHYKPFTKNVYSEKKQSFFLIV